MILYEGIEIWPEAYCPLRESPPRWKHLRWRLFWRFLGKPEPLGQKFFYITRHLFEDREVCIMNPELYAEVERELTTVRN